MGAAAWISKVTVTFASAVTNAERVGRGLELLKTGLYPFVERELKGVYKQKWQETMPSTPCQRKIPAAYGWPRYYQRIVVSGLFGPAFAFAQSVEAIGQLTRRLRQPSHTGN